MSIMEEENLSVKTRCKITNMGTIMKTLIIDYKIPPHLPLLKGGNAPLFGKEGLGEIF